jgi:hypothetical protein
MDNKLPEGWGSTSGTDTPWGNQSKSSEFDSELLDVSNTLDEKNDASLPHYDEKSKKMTTMLVVGLIVVSALVLGILGYLMLSEDRDGENSSRDSVAGGDTADSAACDSTAAGVTDTEIATEATDAEITTEATDSLTNSVTGQTNIDVAIGTKQNVNTADTNALIRIVDIISNGFGYNTLEPFTRIEDIKLSQLLLTFYYSNIGLPHDISFFDDNSGYDAVGWNPDTLNSFFKANLNSNFSLDNFNYRNYDEWSVKWDSSRNAIILLLSPAGGGGVNSEFEITETYQLDGLYYVYATTRLVNWEGSVMEENHYLHIFEKSANSGFDILSKQSLEINTNGTAIQPVTNSTAVGDTIRFGGYNWQVLDVQNNRALILSDKILEDRMYHSTQIDMTWANSDIRRYLNNEFFNSFSTSDREHIVETRIINNNNQWYGISGGIDTTDKIFLLSLDEIVQYFGDSGQLSNRPANALYIDDRFNSSRVAMKSNGNSTWWWLRSPGDYSATASFVYGNGRIGIVDRDGNGVASAGGVRPAMWVRLR